jgi:hypothetical protein
MDVSFRPRDVIQLGNCGIRGRDDRSGRELRDRDVIGMPVGAVRPEGDDDVWVNAPQMFDDGGDNVLWVGAVEFLIAIVEQRNVVHA